MLKESKTILVVDDEISVRDFIVYVLKTTGYNILTAADGEEALQIISSDVDIDLIITDLGMPYSGVRLVKTLRKELNIAIPFIMMSGEHSKVLAEVCMKWGGAGYLAKPFKMSVLRTTVKKVLKQKPPGERNSEFGIRISELPHE